MSDQKPIKVLVVEDSPDDEELVILELKRGGYAPVHERVDTEAGMRAALERGGWDIVISDHSLPGFSGPAALALLRQTGRDIPFIIVSGTVGEEAAVAAVKGGASDYVLKGNTVRLCTAVEREMREAERREEQRRMREQLLIQDRMASVGTLAAGVAHEINNPLTAVLANLELVAKDIEDLAQELGIRERMGVIFEELSDARESADRLRHIVRDLRTFSRVSDEERRGPVNVQRVVESSLRLAWNEIRHRARLVKDFAEVPPVDANEARLGQVFLNLIVNAAQAIPEGDAEHNLIWVGTRVDAGGRVVVEVRDSGSGIAPENLSRLFDAFFTTKPIGVGTGLGLPICHRIVSGLGGEIRVESQLGKGSSFSVFLPRSDKASEPQVSVPPARVPRRGRVLVVDDEPAIARTVARALSREHDVVTVNAASDALARVVGGERYDVILCDVMMPQMTGKELHAELSVFAPDQAERMIFLTGGAFTPGARAFLDQVPNPCIDKPFDTRALLALVTERVK